MNILLLDDEDSHRLLERRALRRGFPKATLTECATVDEALKQCRNSVPYSLAIIDLNIAGISGLEVVLELRKAKTADELPILILSTSQLEEDIRRSYAAGASCYVFKSEDPEDFVRNLQSAIRFLAATAK